MKWKFAESLVDSGKSIEAMILAIEAEYDVRTHMLSWTKASVLADVLEQIALAYDKDLAFWVRKRADRIIVSYEHGFLDACAPWPSYHYEKMAFYDLDRIESDWEPWVIEWNLRDGDGRPVDNKGNLLEV